MILLGCESMDAKGAARRLLTLALKKGYGLAATPPMALGPCGKPFFPDYPRIHFNLSHSGPYALCAVGGAAVGVDVETLRPRAAALPRRVFTAEEYGWYEAKGAEWPAFYTLWTRKESWCKQQGNGIARPRTVCPPLPGEEGGGPAVTGLCGPGWVGAVCSVEAVGALDWIEFSHVPQVTY